MSTRPPEINYQAGLPETRPNLKIPTRHSSIMYTQTVLCGFESTVNLEAPENNGCHSEHHI